MGTKAICKVTPGPALGNPLGPQYSMYIASFSVRNIILLSILEQSMGGENHGEPHSVPDGVIQESANDC